MDDSITVTIADVHSAVSRALDVTEARLGPEVSFALDYYWHLPVDVAFDLTREPETLTVGQVRDDLHEALEDDQDSVPESAWHELSHIVGVLRALEFAARS